MQSGYSILTRRIKGIDVNVWLTLLSVIFISIIILIFKISSAVECRHFDIAATDITGSQKNSLYVNEDVTFTAKAAEDAVWDFDDGTSEKGAQVKHSFKNDGKHTVNVVLNGQCPQLLSLDINKKIIAEDDMPEINAVSGPASAMVNQKVTFTYTGRKKANTFEWSVLNSPIYPIGHRNEVAYKFDAEGRQTVQLRLDNNPARTFTRDIQIAPLPHKNFVAPRIVHNQPSNPSGGQTQIVVRRDTPKKNQQQAPIKINNAPLAQAPFTSDDQFKKLFEEVAEHHYNGQNIRNYLAHGMKTYVRANGESSDVETICDLLFKGKYKIKSVKAQRDNYNNVMRLDIEYKSKSGFLGL